MPEPPPHGHYLPENWYSRLVGLYKMEGCGPPLGDPGPGLAPPSHNFAEARATCLLSERDEAVHKGGDHGGRVIFVRCTPNGPIHFAPGRSAGLFGLQWRSWDNLNITTQDYLRQIPEDAWAPVEPHVHPLIAMAKAGVGIEDEEKPDE